MKTAFPFAGLMIIVVFAGCTNPSEDDQPAAPLEEPRQSVRHHVHANGDFFDPNVLTIEAGDSIVWHLHRGDHQIFVHKGGDADGTFLFEMPLSSGEVSYTFEDAGTYQVFCKNHSTGMYKGMTLPVNVD